MWIFHAGFIVVVNLVYFVLCDWIKIHNTLEHRAGDQGQDFDIYTVFRKKTSRFVFFDNF